MPIFVGLKVGDEGVAFRCFTVNVRSEQDEALLRFLDTDVFKAGLKLLSTAQPAIAPFSGMAYALTKNIAGRHRNIPVQDFQLGLDFSLVSTRARLAEGSYVAVQIPPSAQRGWDWEDWLYDRSRAQVVARHGDYPLVSVNHLVFGVSRNASQ